MGPLLYICSDQETRKKKKRTRKKLKKERKKEERRKRQTEKRQNKCKKLLHDTKLNTKNASTTLSVWYFFCKYFVKDLQNIKREHFMSNQFISNKRQN